jgi:hypothetical protein
MFKFLPVSNAVPTLTRPHIDGFNLS